MYFEAPIYKGTNIGNLILNIGDETLMDIRIITKEGSERKGIKEYMLECLKSMSMGRFCLTQKNKQLTNYL